ncbi:MAG: Cys-tRNA(Pro) deacylase [Eubacterium sp.]|nr:Cys-tRNA(Pro) deacylase [Eubacterium sp.]
MGKQKKDKNKTNVMRLLEQAHIAYTAHEYDHGDDAVDGVTVAERLGQNPDQVFKTLVCKGHSGDHAVFVIPVAKELDLKKAARAAGEKSVEMIHVKDINKTTGYIRGGCSPIGMKKPFKTVFDSTALSVPTIIVSAGKIGHQVELAPADLIGFVAGTTAEITKN